MSATVGTTWSACTPVSAGGVCGVCGSFDALFAVTLVIAIPAFKLKRRVDPDGGERPDGDEPDDGSLP